MPYDGAPSYERPQVLRHELTDQQQSVYEVQAAKQVALDALKQAEASRADFYESALVSPRLDENQKLILNELKTSGDLGVLDHEVDYVNPETGQRHTKRDYFNNAPDVLDAVMGIAARYQEAKQRHDQLAREALHVVAASKELPLDTQQVKHLEMPQLPGTEQSASGLRLVERVTDAWKDHTNAVEAHFHNIEQRLRQPFQLPSIDDILASAATSRKAADVPGEREVTPLSPYVDRVDPFAQEAMPFTAMPQEAVYRGESGAAARSPYDFAGAGDITTMMPVVEQRPATPTPAPSRLRAFLSRFLG